MIKIRMTVAMGRILGAVAIVPAWLMTATASWAADPPTGPKFTNSVGMEFVRFEPGTFTMGAGTDLRIADTKELEYDEQPAHPIKLTKPFYVLTARVSQKQFLQAGLPGPMPSPGCRVSWERASAFCAWLSKKEGRTYRLSTEAEWEYVRKNPKIVTDFDSEWVSDWHGVYRNDSLTDPAGPTTGILKVIRGDATKRLSQPPSVEGNAMFRVVLDTAPVSRLIYGPPPFNQTAVKQSTAPALQGPSPKLPYFTVRFAIPIPPDNDWKEYGSLAGVNPGVSAHNHSPGFEVMPNGDVLATWFSGLSEYGPRMRIAQARLRHGAEEFDMPELLLHVKQNQNSSSLQWREGATNWLFTGANGIFRVSRSTDSGRQTQSGGRQDAG